LETVEITIPYEPREQFLPFHDRDERFAVLVAHRRAGKTVACVNELIKGALSSTRDKPRFAYIAPLFKQAKDVAWEYLKEYTAVVPGREVNETELRVDFPNGGRVRLYGADNPDALRGIYLDGVILDEYADMRPSIWSEVLRPGLSDRMGWATFIGTPKGHNDFWEKWHGSEGNPDWHRLMLKASDTGIINPLELRAAKRDMSEDEYQQEFECSFTAAVRGAYYAKDIEQAESDGRITSIPVEKVLTNTAWDLGIDDATAIWFYQMLGKEVRIIDYYEASGAGLEHYAGVLKQKNYIYGDHYLPHDVEVRELGTGMSRLEMLSDFGINAEVVKMQKVEDGINAVRKLLPRCWFDTERCKLGLEAMRLYRKEWDDKTQTFRTRPLHDWTSHAADAFRYLALGIKERADTKPIKYAQGGFV
jgi:phage terminase large subunit